MIKQLSLLAFSLLVWLPLQVKATQFQYNHDMTCDSPVTADIASMTCDGSETCHLGDEMKVYGSVTLEEDLPSSTLCITVKSCFMGLKFLCKNHLEKVDVCETLGMSADNGATACPSAGSFYFDYLLQLPTDVDWMAMGSGWWVTVYMTLTDCNEYSGYSFGCRTTFRALPESQSSSQSENTYATGAVLIVFGVGYFVFRKRRTASIDLEQEENNATFSMMNDGVRA